MKKMYYYDAKYPQFGLKEFKVKDELYLVGKKFKKTLEYIVTDYSFDLNENLTDTWISITPFYSTPKIFSYTSNTTTYYLSYNRKALEELYKDALNDKKAQLENYLDMTITALEDLQLRAK